MRFLKHGRENRKRSNSNLQIYYIAKFDEVATIGLRVKGRVKGQPFFPLILFQAKVKLHTFGIITLINKFQQV